MTVAIAYGGYSPEWVISEKSARVVQRHLEGRHRTFLVQISQERWEAVDSTGSRFPIDRNDFSFKAGGGHVRFDAVFNAIHGTPGEDGLLQGYWDMLGLPYTSPGPLASALTFNKWFCNGFLRQFADVLVAGSVCVVRGEAVDERAILAKVGLPCFVKPASAGSSFGISKVKEAAGLGPALALALSHDREAIIEAFIEGTEVSCGVYRKDGVTVALAGTEIVSRNEFFDYQAKYEGASEEITPPRIPAEASGLLRQTAVRVFDRLGLRGMSRIDFMVKGGMPYVIEVNTVPGLSEESILPKQVAHAGMELADFFDLLLTEAVREKAKG